MYSGIIVLMCYRGQSLKLNYQPKITFSNYVYVLSILEIPNFVSTSNMGYQG